MRFLPGFMSGGGADPCITEIDLNNCHVQSLQ